MLVGLRPLKGRLTTYTSTYAFGIGLGVGCQPALSWSDPTNTQMPWYIVSIDHANIGELGQLQVGGWQLPT